MGRGNLLRRTRKLGGADHWGLRWRLGDPQSEHSPSITDDGRSQYSHSTALVPIEATIVDSRELDANHPCLILDPDSPPIGPMPLSYANRILENYEGVLEDEDAPAPVPSSAPKQFSKDAMRVLESCEHLLTAPHLDDGDRLMVLNEIVSLKKRFQRPAETRSTISRHRRYSLGSDARRVLKTWVDQHLDDPYPSVAEKSQLALQAGLTMKQINDWFTNFRKRHWEDEMYRVAAADDTP